MVQECVMDGKRPMRASRHAVSLDKTVFRSDGCTIARLTWRLGHSAHLPVERYKAIIIWRESGPADDFGRLTSMFAGLLRTTGVAAMCMGRRLTMAGKGGATFITSPHAARYAASLYTSLYCPSSLLRLAVRTHTVQSRLSGISAT